jgi:hypothetical protein
MFVGGFVDCIVGDFMGPTIKSFVGVSVGADAGGGKVGIGMLADDGITDSCFVGSPTGAEVESCPTAGLREKSNHNGTQSEVVPIVLSLLSITCTFGLLHFWSSVGQKLVWW